MSEVLKKGTLFVISGPSGVGKSTLLNDCLKDLDGFVKSISVTTRPKRENEKLNQNYFFVSEKEFKDLIKKGQLLEWTNYCGYYYGTPKKFVEEKLNEGKNVVLEIDVKGAMEVKKNMKDAYLIFITAPNFNQIESRLKGRGTECKDDINKRLKAAKEELKYEKYYDCIIINNNYNEALKNLKYVLTSKVGGINKNEHS